MRKILGLMAVIMGLFTATEARAWFDGGHMLVAYIAYNKLSASTRVRVDRLLRLNPIYGTWTKHVSANQRGLVAFMMAATWPDCIKQSACSPGYVSDGGDVPPGDSTDAQNIGYSDMLMHKYWHFVDVPFEAGSPGKPPKKPNALTQIELLRQAIGTDEPDNVKSYDVVWLEHLVGDVHQPLHCTSRFTRNHPDGDAGGNEVPFCEKPCKDELHAYWDGLLGDKPSIADVSNTGNDLLARGRPAGADDADPSSWVQNSFELAKTKAYMSPISDDNDPSVTVSPRPDAAYQTTALGAARSQAMLAGYRLAALLNANLK